MKKLTQENFQHCFNQWEILMERCRDKGEVSVEGYND